MAGQSKEAPIPPWGLAVAGATGAVLANAIVYPLDMWVFRPIMTTHEQPSSSFSPRLTNCIGVNVMLNCADCWISNSVKTRLQVQIKRNPNDAVPTGVDAVHYDSTWDAITKIIDADGIGGLYAGFNGALLGVASTNFAYFYWYSVVRTLYLSSQKIPKPPGTAIELSLGAVAGAVAQVFTIPVAVVTTRQQTQGKGEKKGMIDTGKDVIASEDGWTGLWRGLKASLVLVVNPAITYGAYQRLKDIIFPGKVNLRPWEAFRKCPR